MPHDLRKNIEQPIKILACGVLESENAFLHNRRRLEVDSILLGIKGCLFIEQTGTQYEMGPGDMLVLHVNECHSGTRPSRNLSYYWCSFLADDSVPPQRDPEDSVHNGDVTASSLIVPEYMPLPFPDRANILFRQMISNDRMDYIAASKNYLGTALLIELQQQACMNPRTTPEDNARIGNVIAWLNANCSRQMTARDLAQRFHYNERYLSHLIKCSTGYSLNNFINKLRIDKSKSLLLSTDLSIKEIAHAVGIEDDHYYMRIFKRSEMMSPSQYRNSYPHRFINTH